MIKKRKLFFAWQMEKEKKWLEDLARQGYVLKDIKPFKYYFEEQTPKELVYEFDFQVLAKKNEQDYLELFKEWTFVSRYGGWYYFYKEKSNDITDSIYSDNSSRKSLFKRLMMFLLIVAFPLYYQILIMFPNMDDSEFTFPKFYFFMRIIVVLFIILHSYAILRLLLIYRQLTKRIQE